MSGLLYACTRCVASAHDIPCNCHTHLVVFLRFLRQRFSCVQSLGSLVAFQAMVSIAAIGLYISYALPSFFRITFARKTFVPGPINLGRYSIFVGWVAVLWVTTITILFCLPVRYPVDTQSLNYTPVAVGGVLVLALAYWFISARRWFKGPQINLDDSNHDQKMGFAWLPRLSCSKRQDFWSLHSTVHAFDQHQSNRQVRATYTDGVVISQRNPQV